MAKKKSSKLAAAWPIGVGFLIVAGVVGYVLYSSNAKEQRKASQDNVADIASGAVRVSNSKMSVFPDSIGDLIAQQYIEPSQVLSPWSSKSLPANFDTLSEQEQYEWVNQHSDYVYLPSGRRIREGDEIIAFELAPPGKFDEVAMVFFKDVSKSDAARGGFARLIAYDQADALIKAQTGHSIKDWHDAAVPGAGVMTGEFVPRPKSDQHIPRS